MVNGKKAWVRIVEAFLAILVITSAFAFIYVSENQKQRDANYIYSLEDNLLESIASNPEFREIIFATNISEAGEKSIVRDENTNNDKIENYTRENVPANLDFELKVCEIKSCIITSDKNVYYRERILSSNLTSILTRKIALFAFER